MVRSYGIHLSNVPGSGSDMDRKSGCVIAIYMEKRIRKNGKLTLLQARLPVVRLSV